MIRFGQGNLKIVPLACAYNTTATSSNFVKVNNAHWLTFSINWGAVDTAVTVTVTECTSNSTVGATTIDIPFRYRLSGAIGSDTWGAVTTSDSSGVALTASTNDNQLMLIDIDPADLDYNYVRVNVGTATASTIPLAINAILESRYPQGEHLSSS